ncbi:hypothetical protein Ahy_A05g023101 isoform E [Arachis hypogaea]|uniref:Uncharacterized protein n=1 Tax=Arachis hypogaea TaxID=3818 RepID=A0A445D2C5_ARAHY|nr:hypothetical protein Ahy_A05g023101 isoform E [Arachis hypogaea]
MGEKRKSQPFVWKFRGFNIAILVTVHYVTILDSLFEIWGKKDGPHETFGTSKENYTPFVVFMAAAGVLRAANRSTSSGVKLDIVSRIGTSTVICMEALVQGLVNTFGDLQGAFVAVDRINSVLSRVQVDDSLAYGLERELRQQKAVNDEKYKLFFSNSSTEKNQMHYMSALKTSSNLFSLAWLGKYTR